jgi:hypothetical protein
MKERAARASTSMNLVGQLPAPVEALLGRLLVSSLCEYGLHERPGPPGRRTLLGRRVPNPPIVPLFQAMGPGSRSSVRRPAGHHRAADPSLVPDAATLGPALGLLRRAEGGGARATPAVPAVAPGVG